MPIDVTIDQLVQADMNLRLYHPTYEYPVDYQIEPSDLKRLISPEDWIRARAISVELEKLRLKEFEKLSRVEVWLWRQFEAGQIATYVRPRQGGALTPLERSFWNFEGYRIRFISGQFDQEAPFDVEHAGVGQHWIFADAPQLNAALAKLKGMAVQPTDGKARTDDIYLSDYIKCQIAACRRLNVSPQNQPLKKVVETVLAQVWEGATALSKNDIEGMASFVRDPESRFPKGAKSPTANRKLEGGNIKNDRVPP
jgi:hypothetical protein